MQVMLSTEFCQCIIQYYIMLANHFALTLKKKKKKKYIYIYIQSSWLHAYLRVVRYLNEATPHGPEMVF